MLDDVGNEILARKDELGRLLSREEGKTLPEGIGEVVRAGQIFKFFAGEALRLAGEKIPSVRPGVDVEVTREPRRRGRHHHAVEFSDRDSGVEDRAGAVLRQLRRVQAGRPGAGLRVGARRDHRQGGLPPGRVQPGDGRGSVVGEAMIADQRVDAISFTGSVATGRVARREGDRAHGQAPARNGRQEPAGRARRRRPDDRGELRGQRRVLLDRPALHRVVAPDRDRGHPRPIRRRGHRAARQAQGRRRARERHRHRPGGRRVAAQAGPRLHRHRQERRRDARLSAASCSSAPSAATTSRRRCSPTPPTRCASRARKSSARWRA